MAQGSLNWPAMLTLNGSRGGSFASQAMMKMVKLDVAELKKAAEALSWGLGATREQLPESAPDTQVCVAND